jgi:hypothetical protein
MIDEIELFKRYAYYNKPIKDLASFGIASRVRLEDLKPSKGIIQKAYSEMHDIHFKGTLIDYLCWISSNILFYSVRNVSGIQDNGLKNPGGEIIRKMLRFSSLFAGRKFDILNFARYYLNNEDSAIELIKNYGFSDWQEIVDSVMNSIKSMEVGDIFGKKIEKPIISVSPKKLNNTDKLKDS